MPFLWSTQKKRLKNPHACSPPPRLGAQQARGIKTIIIYLCVYLPPSPPIPSLPPPYVPCYMYNSFPLTLPGMQVRVVNSYPAAIDSVSVSSFKSDDLPTLGKPIIATRPSPLLATSKPFMKEAFFVGVGLVMGRDKIHQKRRARKGGHKQKAIIMYQYVFISPLLATSKPFKKEASFPPGLG